ncbi:MAG: nuclear transport factor 2 family protein [Enterobacterales bacterium]|nr:nuclear transport factor 2 family protein [Enterobacterales bacterium]
MQDKALWQAIQTYFDAIYECDVAALDSVFHHSASLFDVDQGKVFTDPIASFRQDVASRPSPASSNSPREDQVILIDWLSEKSAVVKLRLRAQNNIFVDHLSFVKGEKGWVIVAKVWHLERVIVTEE